MVEAVVSKIGVQEPIPGVLYMPLDMLETYVSSGELVPETLGGALRDSFRRHADRTALHTPEGIFSYAELDETTDRLANGFLGLGLRPLDRVIFQSANCKELIFAIVACFKAGLIPVCTLAAHREQEIGYLGCHTDARAHIVQGDDPKFDLIDFALRMKSRIPTLRHILTLRGQPRADVIRIEDLISSQSASSSRAAVGALTLDPYQVGIFQLSGGTTGVPKVIPRMHNDYLLNAQLTANWLGYTSSDVTFMPMPMIHNASMICFWLPTLLSGATFVIPADMTPDAWGRSFTEARPTFIGLIRALVPRLEAMIAEGHGKLERVRAAWGPDSARLLRTQFGIPTHGMFGMSEGMNMYTKLTDPEEVRDWSVGRPLSRFDEVRLVAPGTETDVGVGEIGEMICRGPYTLRGYYNAPQRNSEAFTSDGFYRSGDLMVRREEQGFSYYAFAGRTKDVVVRGHEKINCEEVEHAVCTHAAISDSAVVGMADDRLGERVCVFVVLRPVATPPTVQDLAKHLETIGLAKFKWPERVELIDRLPLTKVGKLDKAALRALISERLAAENKALGKAS